MSGSLDLRSRGPRLVTLVVPVYDERECLEALYAEVCDALDGTVDAWEMLVVDDGSTDGSFEVLRELAARDPRVRALRLSSNRGHQAALACGLDHAEGDVVVTMDADLQHPPALLGRMIELWRSGYDVVSMTKRASPGRGSIKRAVAWMFYRVFERIAEVPLTPGESDFRLLDRKCVLALRAMPERRRFLRGLVRFIGFSRCELSYVAPPRRGGEPKYTLRKLAGLAALGFSSFATSPLRVGLWLGALAVELTLFGLVLITLGVLGAYLSVLLEEVRRRPVYFVAETINVEPRPPGEAR